jgi:hypothetical protein
MTARSLLALSAFLAAAAASAAPGSLVGTWELVHSENTLPDGQVVPYCTGAHGMIIYTPEGYVSVALNCAEEGQGFEPADLTGRKFFYAGTYRYDGQEVVHTLLNASEPAMIGSRPARRVTLRGDTLILSGESQGLAFTATWAKTAPLP